MPVIVKGGVNSWKWIIGPCCLYLLERLYRFYMSFKRPLLILKIVKLPDSQPVMEVQFKKVKTQAGQVSHSDDVTHTISSFLLSSFVCSFVRRFCDV